MQVGWASLLIHPYTISILKETIFTYATAILNVARKDLLEHGPLSVDELEEEDCQTQEPEQNN